MDGKARPVTRTEIDGLIRQRAFLTLAQRTGDALRDTAPGLPKPMLAHARAVGLHGVVEKAGDRLAPSLIGALQEAIGLLEDLMEADAPERSEADAIGDAGHDLAAAWALAYDRQWPMDLPAPADPSFRGSRLAGEAERILALGDLANASALVRRAHGLFRTAQGEAGPLARASVHLLRLTRERLGDLRGAAIQARDAAREQALDDGRFGYAPADLDAYVGLLHRFARAARSGNQMELGYGALGWAVDLERAGAATTGSAAALATTLSRMGDMARRAGNISAAVMAFAELGRLGPWEAEAQAGLGRAWIDVEEYALGLPMLRAALFEAGVTHPAVQADPWLDLYAGALSAGEWDTAEAVRARLAATGDPRGTSPEEIEACRRTEADPERASALFAAILDGPLVSSTFRRVAERQVRLLVRLGRPEDAARLFDGLIGIARRMLDRDHHRLSDLDELGAQVELGLGRPETAVRALLSATSRDRRAASRLLQAGSSAQRARVLAGPRRRAGALTGLVAAHFPDQAHLVGGTHAIITHGKGLNASVEWQKARAVARRAQNDAAMADTVRRLREFRATLSRALLDRIRGGGSGVDVAALTAAKEAAEREAAERTGGFSLEDLADSATPASITMCLPEDGAFVDIVRYAGPLEAGAPPPARYCAFVIRARYLQWRLVDLGPAARIDGLVARFRADVTGDADRAAGFATGGGRHIGPAAEPGPVPAGPLSAGARLRRRVLDRLLPALDGRTRLVVSPDGALRSLPLECLPRDGAGHVIDDFAISYAVSARSLVYMEAETIHGAAPEAAAGHAPPVVVGDPDYGPPASGAAAVFRPLAFTRDEAEAVGAALGVAPVLGAAAAVSAVTGARSPLVLHCATHGYVLGAGEADPSLAGTPLARVGLALAGANAENGDGILTGEEVLSLDLRRTALTVLSACETGLGEAEQGEGLASLGRAFDVAGSQAVVVGLWKVPDAATDLMMREFYAGLAAGQGVAEALRRAKLATRRSHPGIADWGAFVSLGGWGSIALRNWDPAGAGPDGDKP